MYSCLRTIDSYCCMYYDCFGGFVFSHSQSPSSLVLNTCLMVPLPALSVTLVCALMYSI